MNGLPTADLKLYAHGLYKPADHSTLTSHTLQSQEKDGLVTVHMVTGFGHAQPDSRFEFIV